MFIMAQKILHLKQSLLVVVTPLFFQKHKARKNVVLKLVTPTTSNKGKRNLLVLYVQSMMNTDGKRCVKATDSSCAKNRCVICPSESLRNSNL
jgi:hypothetical protein